MCGWMSRGNCLACSESVPKKQAGVGQLVAIGRLAEQLDDLLVSRGLLLGRAAESQRLQQLAVGHHQTIGERELRVDQLVAERHVAQLVREHRREARFVGQHVDEAAAQHDRVADRERLERRGQQDPGVQRPLDVHLVGDDEVVEDGLEDLVRFALRREQADRLESFEDVRLGLLFPSALAEHGRQLRCPVGRCRRRWARRSGSSSTSRSGRCSAPGIPRSVSGS